MLKVKFWLDEKKLLEAQSFQGFALIRATFVQPSLNYFCLDFQQLATEKRLS